MVQDFTKKINRIANKCDKQGIPYTYIVGDPYDRVITLKNGDSFILSITDIELDIQFKFNGWRSLGLIQRKEGITQCYLNSQELIKQYGNTDFHCDHCHKHVYRNSVIVLENDNGERKVVGISCVKEFTCGLDGNLIASFNEFVVILSQRNSELRTLLQGESLDDLPEEGFCEQNGRRIYDIERVVSCVVKLINAYGFEPSNSYKATWKSILDFYRTINENELEAVRAIEWIKSLSDDEITKSSYLFNLRQIVDANYCTYRHFGLLASLIPTYRKAESRRLQESNRQLSNYVGNKGEKFSLTLTYTKSISYESQYGKGYFHFFTDVMGNIYKWSTNKSLSYKVNDELHYVEQGATVQLSGTIKDHEEYRGVKQTIITRCKYDVQSSDSIPELNNSQRISVNEAMNELLSYWG